MSLFNASSKVFKHWMSAYANHHEIEEIGLTNGSYKEFFEKTITAVADDVVDALTSRPFAAFFYGYLNDHDEFVVQLVHHVNKNIPEVLAYDSHYNNAFGICCLQEDRTVVEIDAEIFGPAPGNIQATLSMMNFILASSDGPLFDVLAPASMTQEEEEKGETAAGHPIPVIFPPFVTAILPALVPAFGCTPEKPLIILKRVLLKIATYGSHHLNADGNKLWWAGNFPAIQHL